MYPSTLKVRQFSIAVFEHSCLPCDSKRPLSFPLPPTFQECARKEGTSDPYTQSQFINLPALEAMISTTRASSMKRYVSYGKVQLTMTHATSKSYQSLRPPRHALCPRQLHEALHPLRSRPPVKSENCPGRMCNCGPKVGEVLPRSRSVGRDRERGFWLRTYVEYFTNNDCIVIALARTLVRHPSVSCRYHPPFVCPSASNPSNGHVLALSLRGDVAAH